MAHGVYSVFIFSLQVLEISDLEVLDFWIFSELAILDQLSIWRIKHARIPVRAYFKVIFIVLSPLDLRSNISYTTAFHGKFPRFACWGDLILSQFQNQFCACSAQPRQTCELVLLFNAKIPVSFHIKYCVLERGKDKRNIECFKENNYVTVWSIVGRNT